MRILASIERTQRNVEGYAVGTGWFLGLLFEPRDLWIGVYWDWDTGGMLSVYVCILPVFPIRLTLWGLR